MANTRRCAKLLAGGLASAAFSLAMCGAQAQAQTEAQTATPAAVTPPIITTFAGTGQFGFSGDGGPATGAKLGLPTGAARDAAGNIYFDDTANNRVRRISTSGTITTVAGNGSGGFGGDGGPAKNARLSSPTGVTVDGSGNLYIADTGNSRVRKVTAGGTISTIAGSGGCSLSGNGGPATNAHLCLPTGVAVDGSTVYIADTGNNEIRKVAGGIITAFAGTGSAGSSGDGGPATAARLNIPVGVSLDAAHNAYIADSGNNKVRRVNTVGIITTFAGTGAPGSSGDGGKAILAKFTNPTGLGIDPLGNVYVTDSGNCKIRVVIPKGDVFTYAGTGSCGYSGDGGPATAAKLAVPLGSIAVDANNIYFGDPGNERVRRVQGGPPPNIPEIPFSPALLPISAIVMLGGGYRLLRRRRNPHVVAA